MNKNKEQLNKKEPTPPYLAITKLEEVIDLASNRIYGEFTPSLFTGRGFSPADAFLAINTLKFLGLIDESGKPTEQMAKIGLRGDSRTEVFNSIVRTAYKKLFSAVPSPQELPTDQLFNGIKSLYKQSPRVTRQAVPVFRKLCEYAGLIEKDTVVGRKRMAKSQERTPTKTKKHSQRNVEELPPIDKPFENSTGTPFADNRMVLFMPTEVKNKVLDDEEGITDWSELRLAIKKFADKYIPQEEPPASKEDT